MPKFKVVDKDSVSGNPWPCIADDAEQAVESWRLVTGVPPPGQVIYDKETGWIGESEDEEHVEAIPIDDAEWYRLTGLRSA
jgi:hypothetical protein